MVIRFLEGYDCILQAVYIHMLWIYECIERIYGLRIVQ